MQAYPLQQQGFNFLSTLCETESTSYLFTTQLNMPSFEAGPGLLLVFMDLGDKVTEAEFHGACVHASSSSHFFVINSY
jgi:hypothetical protein